MRNDQRIEKRYRGCPSLPIVCGVVSSRGRLACCRVERSLSVSEQIWPRRRRTCSPRDFTVHLILAHIMTSSHSLPLCTTHLHQRRPRRQGQSQKNKNAQRRWTSNRHRRRPHLNIPLLHQSLTPSLLQSPTRTATQWPPLLQVHPPRSQQRTIQTKNQDYSSECSRKIIGSLDGVSSPPTLKHGSAYPPSG